MKVGILTWYDVLNYGSVFQTYALQQIVNEFGVSAEILKHDRALPDYYGNELSEKSLRGILRWLRNQTPNRRHTRVDARLKYDAFVSFRNEYLNITDHYSKTTVDHVIIGSDQIFDINSMYFPFQFGAGVSCDSISTYAPCFGETTLECLKNHINFDEICSSIKKLSVTNARDRNTKEILSYICGETVPMVLDPTLLYSFKMEKSIWSKRLVEEKYCVVYTWGGFSTSSEFAEACKAFAKVNKLKLISVGERRLWCDIQWSTASPIEFFELFMHADMVLTNMFHGTCFSILMERPFYSFVMPHNENKLGGLLQFMNLEAQIKYDTKFEKNVPDIDYNKVNTFLEEQRKISLSSLIDAIGVVEK